MRKIFILLFITACLSTSAQEITFNYSGDKVTCEVTVKDSVIHSIDDVIDYHGEIKSVRFKENPALSSAKEHTFQVNGLTILSLKLKESNSGNLSNPITLGSEEKITCKRGEDVIGTIIVKKTFPNIEELLKGIEYNIISHKSKSFTFENDKEEQFEFFIKGIDKVNASNYKVLCNDNSIQHSLENGKLEFTINPKDLKTDDISHVYLNYDVTIDGQKVKKKQELLTLESRVNNVSAVTRYGLIALGACILLYIFLLYWKKRKWGKEGKKYQDINGDVFSILSFDEPQIGDIGNKVGTFELSNGYIYEFKKDSFWGKISLRSILIKIQAKDKSFNVYKDLVVTSYPRGIYTLPNSDLLYIGKGTKADGEGDYELENGYIFEISKGFVKSVKLKIKDIRNTAFIVSIQSESPQKGDSVLSFGSGKIEMADGLVYEISKQRKIVNIYNKGVEESKEIVLTNGNGEKLTVSTKKQEPSIGDRAVPNGKFCASDGKVYVVENESIKVIYEKPQDSIEELRSELEKANRKILELGKRPTIEAYSKIVEKLDDALKKIKEDAGKLADVDKAIESAVKLARQDEKKKVDSQYRIKISEEYISLASYRSEKSTLERLKEEAIKAKNKAEEKVKLKEGEIKTYNDKISTLEGDKKTQSELIIRLKASISKMKDVAQKKNVHYLLQVQEALSDISESFKDVYKDIEDSTIKEGLITPMVKGVSGLSAGILSWSEDFSVKVLGDSDAFFGSDYLTLSEDDVKEQLAKKFVSNIVKSDSFSKFVRLYQLSMVPFIRKQLIDAKMNIETLNKLYYKVYTLISDFGYTIICPRLFEEQHSDNKYQWFNSTNLFNIISLPDSEREKIKENGPETIIDVNQIGFESPWASRKATAVTPDF
jgi:hypothetical protein